MRFSTKAITTCAVLAALALALSYLESFFPPLLPLPGVKLGLANIVTVYALYALGASSALAILVVRCLLGSLFAGNASALLFSLLGGLAAMLVMIALHALPRLSVYGVSVGGAAAHNCGQVAAAMLTLGSAAPLAYLPFLLLVSVFYRRADRLCRRAAVPRHASRAGEMKCKNQTLRRRSERLIFFGLFFTGCARAGHGWR